MEHTMINVLLVDDEAIVREGIKHLIDWNNLGFCICGEASNGEEALEKSQKIPAWPCPFGHPHAKALRYRPHCKSPRRRLYR